MPVFSLGQAALKAGDFVLLRQSSCRDDVDILAGFSLGQAAEDGQAIGLPAFDSFLNLDQSALQIAGEIRH